MIYYDFTVMVMKIRTLKESVMNRKVLFIIAILVLSLGNVLAAEEPAKNKADQATLIEKGREAFDGGDYLSAVEISKDASKLDRTNPDALELFGLAHLAVGDPGTAKGALQFLTAKRGTARDFILLALAKSMAGDTKGAERTLKKAEAAKGFTAEDLYALAWQKPDGAGRLEMLKRTAAELPPSAGSLAPEIAFWEGRKNIQLRKPDGALGAGGATLKMKTLYGLEWVSCRAGDDKEVYLLVDTASRITLLPRVTVEKLGLTTVKSLFKVPGAYPQEDPPEYGIIDALDFGGYRITNVPFQVVEDESGTLKYREGRQVLKGILGMDLLRNLQVNFDRKENELRLYPAGTPLPTLLASEPKEWIEIPAFSVYDQMYIKSGLGEKRTVLSLVATGCTLVMVTEGQLSGSGLKTDSKNLIDLTPSGRLLMSPTNTASQTSDIGRNTFQEMSRLRSLVLGWLDEALPMVGTVRSVNGSADVGLGGGTFQIQSLPIYPNPVGGEFEAALVMGRKITDYYAMAWDLDSGKLYIKQVLFTK